MSDPPAPAPAPAANLTKEALGVCPVATLKEMCRTRGLQVSGKRAVLIEWILDPETAPKSKRTKTATASASKPRVPKYMPRRTVVLKRNAAGNFEDPTTRFVFDPERGGIIVGVQLDVAQKFTDPKTGVEHTRNTRALTPEEQEKCVMDGFEFERW